MNDETGQTLTTEHAELHETLKPELTILNGDNREVLKRFADNTFHAIVTDPPYEMGFMGRGWDRSGIAYDQGMWRECLRVLKPGGYLLSFGGSRTYHRMACAIEDAGFEIRDMIEWLYGSGFPKSMAVSKAMDKADGKLGEIIGSEKVDIGIQGGSMHAGRKSKVVERSIRAAATVESRAWHGWGTALKPAHEPICVARKALDGTVVENIRKWGCGAVNIDGCRVGMREGRKLNRKASIGFQGSAPMGMVDDGGSGRFPANLILDSESAALLDQQAGDCPAGGYPNQRGKNNVFGESSGGNFVDLKSTSGGASRYFQRCDFTDEERELNLRMALRQAAADGNAEQCSALRFYYTAKASGSERGNHTKSALPLFGISEEEFRNTHPTVKPLALMRYLLRLVVPDVGDGNLRGDRSPEGKGCDRSQHSKVLDPFLGSGTTALACRELGFDCTGIELEAEHMAIIWERLGLQQKETKVTEVRP